MLHRRKCAVIALIVFKLLSEAGQPPDLSTNTLGVLEWLKIAWFLMKDGNFMCKSKYFL